MISKTSFSGQIQDCWNYEKAPYSQHKIRFLKITVCNMLDKQIKNEINYFITLIILRQNSSEYHSVNRPKWGHSELILSSWLGFLTWSIIFFGYKFKIMKIWGLISYEVKRSFWGWPTLLMTIHEGSRRDKKFLK